MKRLCRAQRGMLPKVLCGGAAALVIHLVIGWAWTLAAGVGAGFWQGRCGWLAGAGSVGLSFSLLIAYNFVAAPVPVGRMGAVMGGIMGGLPPAAVFVLTGLIGLLIGAVGGGLGAAARQIIT